MPRCIVIARPNGAGKPTFGLEFLPETDVLHFVNVDLIAAGLSAFKPAIAAMAAARVFLAELERLAAGGENFAFESTLSGRSYAARIGKWKSARYRIEMVYLKIDSLEVSLKQLPLA